ncbi:TPA: hypothetical protein DEG21_05125 [Patescibacteria group bacterium]|nr:hypothetical protein [Candidatus Gracilibacteria bacterium]HBY75212.1 hypothetical protein [Candidatus Gracilibacteria bacterium]
MLGSKTVSRIINLVERKNWEQSPTEPESYVCDEIYNRFIKLSPISKKERDYLLSFFENEKTKSTAQEIVSKLNIQH